VGDAWALRAISCASTALLVCPIVRWWVPGLPGVGLAGGAMRECYLQLPLVDDGWSFASKFKMRCCPSGNELTQTSIEADSTNQKLTAP